MIETTSVLGSKGVRVSRAAGDNTGARFFNFQCYGGRDAALAEARKYERWLLTGLRTRWAAYASNGQPYLYIVGSWRVNGKRAESVASVEKHGVLEAVRLVTERRQQATGFGGLPPRKAWTILKRGVSSIEG